MRLRDSPLVGCAFPSGAKTRPVSHACYRGPVNEKRRSKNVGVGVAIGVAVGAAIGAAMDNIAVGMAIGIAIGVSLGSSGAFGRRRKDDDESESA